MFEKEIQFITDFNLNKIKNLGASFTYNDLFGSDLHPALIKFISGRTDLMIFEERKILLENSRFDYSGSKIAGYFNLIADEIKKTKKFFFREAEDFLKKGVIFNANFCVQPKSTLINLIFKDSDNTRNTSEIIVFLNYLYYYGYYREIVTSYLTKRKIVNLTKDEFKGLLDKIDSQILLTKKESVISDAVNSISDFYNDGGVTKSSLQPALIEAYLKEKGLAGMIDALQNEIKDYKKKINNAELKRIIFTPPPLKTEEPDNIITPEAAEEQTYPEVKEEVLPDIEFKDEIAQPEPEEINSDKTKEEVIPEQEEKTEPVIKVEKEEAEKVKEEPENKDAGHEVLRDASEIKPENKPQQEEHAPVKQDIPEQEKRKSFYEINQENIKKEDKPDEDLTYQEPNWVLHTDESDSPIEEEIIDDYNPEDEIDIEEVIEDVLPAGKDSGTRKDIFSYLNQKDADRIISGVFNDDEDDFINTLEKISECSNYESAAEILKSAFFTYKVNPYKREAVTLTNVVSNYFDQD